MEAAIKKAKDNAKKNGNKADKKGKPIKVKDLAYDKKSGCMIFTAKDLSIFGIGYKGK